jgi:hypothetical protein
VKQFPTTIRFLALLALLSACSRHEPPPPLTASAKPTPAPAAPVRSEPAVEAPATNKLRAGQLMQAIFADDYRTDDDTALVGIDEGEDAGYWRMTLYAAKDLPDGRTIVVVNGAPSDENGVDNTVHLSPGMLSVYTLRRINGAWQPIERYLAVTTMGSNGNIGIVKWITLGAGRLGIVVSSGGTWFGRTFANAQIFDLDRGMRDIGGFAEFSSIAGACEPDMKDCWDISGKIRTMPGEGVDGYYDIVVAFEGKHFRVTEDAQENQVEHTTRIVRQSARYRFNGKEYLLAGGTNPVPSIEG